MRRTLALVTMWGSTGCGGEWVDASNTCDHLAFESRQLMDRIIALDLPRDPVTARNSYPPEYREENSKVKNLEDSVELQFTRARRSSATEEQLSAVRAPWDAALAKWAGRACADKGLTYAGDWECAKEQRRVRCK